MSVRYGLSLKMDCDNSAFQEGERANEIARILRDMATKIERESEAFSSGTLAIGSRLWDRNGNTCGEWEIKPRRIRD
jgi:hypothetical protein